MKNMLLRYWWLSLIYLSLIAKFNWFNFWLRIWSVSWKISFSQLQWSGSYKNKKQERHQMRIISSNSAPETHMKNMRRLIASAISTESDINYFHRTSVFPCSEKTFASWKELNKRWPLCQPPRDHTLNKRTANKTVHIS